MLDNDWTPRSALDIFVKDMSIVTSTARLHGFPLPLSAAAEQLYISGSSQGYGREDDAGVIRVYCPKTPSTVHENAIPLSDESDIPGLTPPGTPIEVTKIGFIGLGAMGLGMASSLVKAGFHVAGFDVYPPSIEKFVEGAAGENASQAASPADAATSAQVLILMVQNAAQAEDVLFGSGKAAASLPDGATIMLNSTVPPAFVRNLAERVAKLGRRLDVIDAPVSGGVVRAANGQLTVSD